MWDFHFLQYYPVPDIPLSYMDKPREISFVYCYVFLPLTPKHQVALTTTFLAYRASGKNGLATAITWYVFSGATAGVRYGIIYVVTEEQ